VSVTKYQLASQAMVMVGASPISGFNGNSAEEIIAGELYEPTVLDIVSKYRWRCMSGQFQLSREGAVPRSRWEAAYRVPSDAEVVHGVFVDDHPIKFDRYENRILCDARVDDVVVMDYTYRSGEEHWPAYFAGLVRTSLAAAFAIPVAEDTQKASFYGGKFIREFAQAKSIDAQGRTARKLPVGGLARYSGGRP